MKEVKILFYFLLIGVSIFFLTQTPSVYSATTWTQTDWFGGPGQTSWSDATKYSLESGVNTYTPDQATLNPSTWANAYGGSGSDTIWSIRKTSDGGMILGGSTDSSGAGTSDGLLVKLDSSGNILWQKTYGGTDNDYFTSIQQTSDGGYIATGYSMSFGIGGDFWVVKTDSLGNVLWQKSFGGANFEYSTAVIENSAGNYMILGSTMSFGSGSYDVWVLELNPVGSVVWQNVYGGTNYDLPNTPDLIKQTLDGGYIIACDSKSFSSQSDLLVFKINSTGSVLWQNVYGGLGGGASGIVVLADGSYMISGDVNSFGAGNYDGWILHLDASGNILWQKTYGGAGNDNNINMIQTSDGNFFVSGNISSSGFGGYDIWAMKIDISGNILWQKTYGGTSDEHTYSMPQEMPDGGLVIGGYTGSFGTGGNDIWVLKLAPDGSIYDSSSFGQDLNIVPADGLGVVSAASLVVSSPVVSIADTTAISSDAVLVKTPTSSSGGENYLRNGILTSSIFDAGSVNSWGPLHYTADVPENTSISFEVSTDGELTWEPVTDYVTQTFGPSQTVAYRATLTSTDGTSTPVLQDVSLNGSESPVVLTSSASSINIKGATFNGNIIGIGGAAVTERGFEYGLTNSYGSSVSESSGPYNIGTFSTVMTNLSCDKTYHYRAYATNSIDTGYGEDTTFTTPSCIISSGGGGGGANNPPTVCVPPQILANGVCVNPPPVVPVCISPQTLVNNICVNLVPVKPTCVPPQTLVDNVCVSPVNPIPTPEPIVPPVISPPTSVPVSPATPPASSHQPETNKKVSKSSTNLTSISLGSVFVATRVFTNDPVVKAVKNIAVAVPVTFSFLALLTALLSGIPIQNYFFYLFVVVFQFLGFAKMAKPWGTVYDSVTKRPLPYARVEVLNEQSRKLQSTIADANGRYGFLISGQLTNARLVVHLTGYDFPSQKEPSLIEQKMYPHIYRGGLIATMSDLTNLDLPMDPRDKPIRNFYFGISSVGLNNFLTKVANVLFALGLILGLANVFVNPKTTSYVVLVVLLVTYVLRFSGFGLKPFGLTKDTQTNKALPFSFVALHNQGGERMNFTVSDEVGRYFLLTPRGKYLLRAFTPSYVAPTRTKEMSVVTRKGWISGEIKI